MASRIPRLLALMLALLALAGVSGAQGSSETGPEGPAVRGLPGVLPGTERWHVTFKSRSFDLLEFRAAIQARVSPDVVDVIVAELEGLVRSDQAGFVRFIQGLGGAVIDQWWLINACAIEIPPERLAEVRGHPRVAFIHPDQIREIASPIRTSTNTANHVVDPLRTRSLLGQGGVVAIMDTGLDVNMNGIGRPHRTFFVDGDSANLSGGGIGGSRILANYQMGSQASDDPEGHGTGVAGIAAGEDWGTTDSGRGHAPRASIVGYAIADRRGGSTTSAIVVRTWQQIAADRARHGIMVANLSYTGSPSPIDPAQQALDSVALNADILPVVSCGNSGQSTTESQSCANGLAVGAVHPTAKTVWVSSSRGPLSLDIRRFYPDLVACGAGIVMPKRDDEANRFIDSGTSMAAPQVAGAATLFRSIHATATALETKAALLATTEDISEQNFAAGQNVYGLGFLRDDHAVAMAQGQGVLLSDSLTTSVGSKSIPLNVIRGRTYAAVVVWHRHTLTGTNWSNLALAARVGTVTLARSDTPRNLYEKVIFLAPATGTVTLEVSASSLEVDPLPFALAAIELPSSVLPSPLVAYGTGGCASGFVPTWHTGGEMPAIGNSGFRLVSENLIGGTPGLLFLSGAALDQSFLGLTLYVDPSLGIGVGGLAAGPAGVAGAGTAAFPLPIPQATALAGARLFLQGFFFDAALASSLVHTAGLEATFARTVPAEVEAIRDRSKYQALFAGVTATQADQLGRAIWAASRVPGFRYVKTERFANGGESHWMVIVAHEHTWLEFCLIPGGGFRMGDINKTGWQDELPLRRVRMRPFLLARTEVPQWLWHALMGSNPSARQGQTLPVECVSWLDARAFCAKVGLRLPSEAEWEYACRAGVEACFSFGENDPPSSLWLHGWSAVNSGLNSQLIAGKLPNAFGLHDMHGNVWEWCEDAYQRSYDCAPTDGSASPGSSITRTRRGGGWSCPPRNCRSATRGADAPDHRAGDLGFRPAGPPLP